MNRKDASILFLLILLSLVLSACDGITGGDEPVPLEASGFIEVVEVVAAPEIGGRVAQVYVDQGDMVQAGDSLFRLDDSLLAGQRVQAVVALEAAAAALISADAAVDAAKANLGPALAAVEVAESGVEVAEAGVSAAAAGVLAAEHGLEGAEIQYQMALLAARNESRTEQLGAWAVELPEPVEAPPWYFERQEWMTFAEGEMAAAELAVNDRTADLANLMADPDYSAVFQAESDLAEAQAAFLVAAEIRDRAIEEGDGSALDEAVQEAYDQALAELETAQADEALFESTEGESVLEARANLAAAQERLETATDNYLAMLTGEESLSVAAAESAAESARAGVDQARAQQDAAEARVSQAEGVLSQAQANVVALQAQVAAAEAGLTQAETALAQAQAALDSIDLQLEKLTVSAAVSGVIMVRSIQPGEVIGPGTPAMTIGILDELTVTVYLPENRYGQISLGDQARVNVDSYPDESFPAEVSAIADEAEFTPRNVQTSEERQTTVYAVELRISEPDGRLKPGMPADVAFEGQE